MKRSDLLGPIHTELNRMRLLPMSLPDLKAPFVKPRQAHSHCATPIRSCVNALQWRNQVDVWGTYALCSKISFILMQFSAEILPKECVPVGCISSAAVAICLWGGRSAQGVSTRGSAQGGRCLPMGCFPACTEADTPLCTEFLTQVCENITLPQLGWRTTLGVGTPSCSYWYYCNSFCLTM